MKSSPISKQKCYAILIFKPNTSFISTTISTVFQIHSFIHSFTTPVSYFNHGTECLSQMNEHSCILHLQIILHEEAKKCISSSNGIVSVTFNFLTNEKKIHIRHKINKTYRRNLSNESKSDGTIYSFIAEGKRKLIDGRDGEREGSVCGK